MKHLVRHLIRNNLSEIVAKSLVNCHAPYVGSVMLLESPGKTIRLFVAEPGHQLDANLPENWGYIPMTVGFHAHHCNLTLSVVAGEITNWVVAEKLGDGPLEVTGYRYHSKLRGEAPGFTPIQKTSLETRRIEVVPSGQSVHMLADEVHTVGVKGIAAWLVFEGTEDPDYIPVCYSREDLTKADLSTLYRPAELSDVARMLKLAQLL